MKAGAVGPADPLRRAAGADLVASVFEGAGEVPRPSVCVPLAVVDADVRVVVHLVHGTLDVLTSELVHEFQIVGLAAAPAGLGQGERAEANKRARSTPKEQRSDM